MYIDKITINEPLGGETKEFEVFNEKKYNELVKKNNNKLFDTILFLTSNSEYTTTTTWPVNETGNHIIMDSNEIKAITSWDEEGGYRKIIYNRDPLLYIYCTSPGTIHLNGEDVNLTAYDNYFEIDKIEQGSTFVPTSGGLNAIIARECKLPPSLKGLFFDNMDGPTFASYIEIVVDDSVIDMEEAFYYCGFRTINTSNWDTSNVTSMYNMFSECSNLTSLDVSNWDTSNVTSMGSMFANCTSLQSLDVSNWDTSNVTSIYNIFYECTNLTSLDVSNWDVSKVIDMQYVFERCEVLRSLDVSNWDTSKAKSMSGMFHGCKFLESLDVSNWDVSKVTSMKYMFDSCKNLNSLNLSKWDVSSVTDMQNIFHMCNKLTSLDLSNWDVSNVTNINYMFMGCWYLTSLKFPGVGKIKASKMFFDVGSSPLDHDSVMSIFNYNRVEAGLSALTIQLHPESYNCLTEEEKAEITAKGYTIDYVPL